MAKAALLNVLERTIGRYVLNIDAQNLNMSIWSGKIELKGMELNVDAINEELSRIATQTPDLAIPIRVISGLFSSIEIEIPWTRITSQPCCFRAKGLSIFVEPFDHISAMANLISTGSTIHQGEGHEQRKIELEQANALRESANTIRDLTVLGNEEDEESNEEENELNQKGSYASRLTQRILENLQFDLEDLNISLKGSSFSFGAVLQSLSLFTTNKHGVRKFMDRKNESFLYKSLHLFGLGVYCGEPIDDITKISDEAFLLSPLSLQINLRLSDSEKCVDFPKFQINSELPKLSLTLSQNQLYIINKIGKSLKSAVIIKPPLFPEYRPDVPIRSDTVKIWWKYAFRCVGRITRKTSWTEFFKAFIKKKNYISLYSRYIYSETCPWLEALSELEIEELKNIDEDTSISVEGIMGWRNFVDAQIKREKKSHEDYLAKKLASTSYFSAFFGSSDDTNIEQPVVSLTADELKELESISMDLNYVTELSEDSWIYDISFKLKSFKVSLVKSGPITSFAMNNVATSFVAHADGHSKTEFVLSNVIVEDLCTANTLFPFVLRSLESPDHDTFSNALKLKMEKKQNGDKDVFMRMVAFEFVASALVFKEVSTFFAHDEQTRSFRESRLHPMVLQSKESGEDVFYDTLAASQFPDIENDFNILDDAAVVADKASVAISDNFTEAINNAWKAKQTNKQIWIIDIDIHAPMIVIPEDCSDPEASVLLFDGGKLTIDSGQSSNQVHEWFHANGVEDLAEIEQWKLEITKLYFAVGKANKHDWQPEKLNRSADMSASETILGPISVHLSLGNEKKKEKRQPRTCVFGVVPALSVNFSPLQIVEFLSVSNAWSAYIKEMSPKVKSPRRPQRQGHFLEKGPSIRFITGEKGSQKLIERTSTASTDDSVFFASVALRKLSIVISNEFGGIETHLISVILSSTKSSEGFTFIRLRMGWFWILDQLSSSLPRKQKLLAHSELPRPASSYTEEKIYDILADLKKIGVFDEGYSGSSELADISYYSFSDRNIRKDLFLKEEVDLLHQYEEYDTQSKISLIDSKFSSLYVNWNPQAIKNIMNMNANMTELIKRSSLLRKSSERSLYSSGQLSFSSLNQELSDSLVNSSLMVSARFDLSANITFLRSKLKKVEISLNSAKDDMAMFTLTMAGAKVNYFSFVGSVEAMIANIGLDDLRMETPSGRLISSYTTVLGLAPNQTSSLLTVDYYRGKTAVARCDLTSLNKEKCDTCAKIVLSPMRFVFLYHQIMTFYEYISIGVLGALTSNIASSTAKAAEEVSQPMDVEKLYHITASGFDIVLPRTGNTLQRLSLSTHNVVCQYKSLPNFAGSEIKVSFEKLFIVCDKDLALVDTPIEMKTLILMPSTATEETDFVITRNINVEIPRAFFLISHSHYNLIMSILSENIGGSDSFLRADSREICLCDFIDEDVLRIRYLTTHSISVILPSDSATETEVKLNTGEDEVLPVKRNLMNFNFEVLGLQLNDADDYDPIVYIAAVNTAIGLHFMPDKEKMCIRMALNNMTIEDRRVKTLGRYFRRIISQQVNNGENGQDVFQFRYEKFYSGTREFHIELGSPQVVLIPDILPDLYKFISNDEVANTLEDKASVSESRASTSTYLEVEDTEVEDIQIQVKQSNEIEVGFGLNDVECVTTKVTLKTLNCRFVLVDMGGVILQDLKKDSAFESSSELNETIVLQCKMNTSYQTSSDAISGLNIVRDLEVHCDSMEIYVAQGLRLLFPLQILEPSSFHCYFKSILKDEDDQQVSLSFYTSTKLDFTLSMQNIALVNAIVSSIAECSSAETIDENEEPIELSAEETSRIQAISSGLNTLQQESSFEAMGTSETDVKIFEHSHAPNISKKSSRTINFNLTLAKVSLTIINDMQGLDQALIKIISERAVSDGEIISFETDEHSNDDFSLNFNFNSSFLIDYYDLSSNRWENFLTNPWEFALKVRRHEKRLSKSSEEILSADFDSQACCISFSEQLLVSAGAASKMWNAYSSATESKPIRSQRTGEASSTKMRETIKRSIARSLVTTLPYGLNNSTGINVSFSIQFGTNADPTPVRMCSPNKVEYFQFDSSKSMGVGRKRLYGQDIKFHKIVKIFILDHVIEMNHIDNEINNGRRAHALGNLIVFSEVSRSGKTTLVNLSSQVKIRNCTMLPFNVTVKNSSDHRELGTCYGATKNDIKNSTSKHTTQSLLSSAFTTGKTILSTDKPSEMGIPIDMVHDFININDSGSKLTIYVSPLVQENVLNPNEPLLSSLLFCGSIALPPIEQLISKTQSSHITMEVPFSLYVKTDNSIEEQIDVNAARQVTMSANVKIGISLVDDAHPFVELFIQPRAVFTNVLPVNIALHTLQQHTFSIDRSSGLIFECRVDDENKESNDVHHSMHLGDIVEVFSAGSSSSFSVSYLSNPIEGPSPGWFPFEISLDEMLQAPIPCSIPRTEEAAVSNTKIDFFISEEIDVYKNDNEQNLSASANEIRFIYFTSPNFVIDKTKKLQFEYVQGVASDTAVLPTFLSLQESFHATLLPDSSAPLRLVKTVKKDKIRKSLPFILEDVSICEGGVESSPILWEDKARSEYYAYRRMIDYNRFEIHIIPEFVIYNGSSVDTFYVKQKATGTITMVPPEQIVPLFFVNPKEALLAFEVREHNVTSAFYRVDLLEMKIALLKSNGKGEILGSFALQTVIGNIDSRLVIKLGNVSLGRGNVMMDLEKERILKPKEGFLSSDFIGLRLKLTALQVTLNDTVSKESVTQFYLDELNVEYQRTPKPQQKDDSLSFEKSDVLLTLHGMKIIDCDSKSLYPIIFNSPQIGDLIKLNIKIIGSLSADIVKVESINLALAQCENKSVPISIKTSEDFVWRVLDVSNRVLVAVSEIAGVLLILDWDEEKNEYIVTVVENSEDDMKQSHVYTPPHMDRLYNINTARISPIDLNVSFLRAPQSSKEKKVSGKDAALMDYMMKKLKFKVENANVRFDGYTARNIRGPPDRVLSEVKTVYIHRIKGQIIMLLTAVSIQDWKVLASRKGGSDEYVEGDVLRITGNAIGSSAGYILKTLTAGIGDGVISIGGAIGGGFQYASEAVGLGYVGESVNIVVTGASGGVGTAVKGVGRGASSFIRNTGRGAGQIVGGITGGAEHVAKGLQEGIVKGDGKAVLYGINEGISSTAQGLGEGFEIAAKGAVNAAYQVGDGCFSGVKQVGEGFFGLFKCCEGCVIE